MVAFPSVGKDVLCVLVLAGMLFFVGCAKMVTTPVKVVVGMTLKPAKIVTDATVDLLEKPVRKAVDVARSAKPSSLLKKP
ncbi:uncharacterized protein METZ01_LOCUS411886 [marine metagenome]|uniref:Uncharacterized protein n=1 Tax=marine metagenome TaxID=408172 RepID=A0A382WJS0_9ZZZZ